MPHLSVIHFFRCPDEEGKVDNKLLEALITNLMKALEDRNLKIRKVSYRSLYKNNKL